MQKNGKNIRKFRFQGGVTVKLHSLEFLLTNQKHELIPKSKTHFEFNEKSLIISR